MRLLVLTDHPSSRAYGADRSLLMLTRALADKGHKITLLYHKDGDLLRVYRWFCEHVIQLRALPVFGIRKLASVLPGFMQDVGRLPKARYDLVYSNQYPYLLFGSFLALRKGLPLVCHHRDAAPEKMSAALRAALAHVSTNIFVSQATRDHWVARKYVSKNRSVVVHNGVRTDYFHPPADFRKLKKKMKLTPGERTILFVGRLDRQKGPHVLINAFARLRRKRIRARLWLAGEPMLRDRDYDYEKWLVSLTSKPGVREHVEFLGFQEDLLPYYQASDVTVLPSVYEEPFGRAPIESMACGTPAIGSRIGGIPELFTGAFSKFLFEPGDDKKLAALLEKTLDWRKKTPRLGQQCRKHVLTHFSLEITARGVEQALLKTCRR